jgi:hypothetical protein
VKLPNAERAIVNIAKLRDYCLNPEHPEGQHKAYVFATRLGLRVENAEELQAVLLTIVSSHEAVFSREIEHGKLYVVDFVMTTPVGQATVRSSWIIRNGEDFPRLTSCYII